MSVIRPCTLTRWQLAIPFFGAGDTAPRGVPAVDPVPGFAPVSVLLEEEKNKKTNGLAMGAKEK